MYNFISNYYDMLFPQAVYDEWKSFAKPIIQKSKAVQVFKEKKEKPLVVDAGCGSGEMAAILAKFYDVIGVDISPDMLSQAVSTHSEENITWVCQDISKMEIGRKAAAVFATTDTLNHITNKNKLFAFFNRAFDCLESGGFLFFDVVMPAFFKNNYGRGECSFEDFDWGSFFWTCEYTERTGKVLYEITAFERCEGKEELYRRYDETISEKIWSTSVLREGLTKAGFQNFTVYDNLSKPFEFAHLCPEMSLDDYERLYFICEKP